jgi:hypothetical protein
MNYFLTDLIIQRDNQDNLINMGYRILNTRYWIKDFKFLILPMDRLTYPPIADFGINS